VQDCIFHTTCIAFVSWGYFGFEPAIPASQPASQRPQTHALDRPATGIDHNVVFDPENIERIGNLWNVGASTGTGEKILGFSKF
jgi:hypothetical protein